VTAWGGRGPLLLPRVLMRIGLNGLILRERPTGVHQYVDRLARALAAIDDVNEYVFYVGKQTDPAPYQGARWRVHRIPLSTRRGLRRVLYEQFRLPGRLAADGIDLFHSPTYTLPWLLRRPAVVTIHDLITFTHPELCRKSSVRHVRRLLPRTVARAMRIIVPTEHVRSQLIKLAKAPPEKVVVVPHGVGEEFKPLTSFEESQARRANQWPDRFILYAGALEPKKNLRFIIRGFYAAIMSSNLTHHLVMAGPPGWRFADDIAEAERLGIGDRVHLTGWVPPRALATLYGAAELVVFPSLVEGFGLPILEAMSCGAPVITSTHPACMEVSGGAALHVDPSQLNEFREAIEKVLTDKSLARGLVQKGLARSAEFTWARTARATIDVYKQAKEAWEAIGKG
jgi:glycosyltransferase involved in cell wall biosynthesis